MPTTMTAQEFVDRSEAWAKALEDKEAERAAVPLSEARVKVSGRAGVNPGTLENLRKGRLKAIAAHVYEALRVALIRELEAEMRALDHQLHVLRQSGEDPRSDKTAAVLADIAVVRRALGLKE